MQQHTDGRLVWSRHIRACAPGGRLVTCWGFLFDVSEVGDYEYRRSNLSAISGSIGNDRPCQPSRAAYAKKIGGEFSRCLLLPRKSRGRSSASGHTCSNQGVQAPA